MQTSFAECHSDQTVVEMMMIQQSCLVLSDPLSILMDKWNVNEGNSKELNVLQILSVKEYQNMMMAKISSS